MSCDFKEYKKADIGDARVEYLEYPGNGPSLIMLHATGFLPWVWHPVARDLSCDYNVLAPFFCKHREPDMENGGLGWKVLARDLAKLFQTLDIPKPYYLVGHSMGGAIATLATTLFGLQPEAMVLIEPIIVPEAYYTIKPTLEQHPLASKSIKRRNHWENRQEAREYLLSKKFFASWNPEVLDLYLEYAIVKSRDGLTLACQPEKEAALFLGSSQENPWPLLKNVDCPVLVLEGETTENKGFISFEKIAAAFPKGKFGMVKNTGHLIPMERPQKTQDLIRNFFAS
ncbi:MAG: alpha/beta hydrolase [Desulfatibacillum sp.]|nr:alpha/beta hydrolase [Desulfatibacillum sp.]